MALPGRLRPGRRTRLSDALWWLGELAESVACKERAFALFRDREDPSHAAYAALLLCLDYRKQYGNTDASGGWLAQAARLVEDHGLDELRGWLLFATSFDCEDPVRAEQPARDAHELGRQMGDWDLELHHRLRLCHRRLLHGSRAVRRSPGERLPVPRLGHSPQGRVPRPFPDGRVETLRSGGAYRRPGHRLEVVEDSEYREFSPTRELRETYGVVARNMEDQG